MKKEVSVSVEQSAYEVVVGLSKIAGAVKVAMADGFQPAQDLPAIVMEAVKDLPGVMAALPSIQGDLDEDKEAFVKGVVLGAFELLAALKK